MHYFTKDETKRLLGYSFAHNRRYHASMLVSLYHGLRVSELLGLKASDFSSTTVVLRRLKGNRTQLQGLRATKDPVWDETLTTSFFPLKISRQRCDQVLRQYCKAVQIPDAKAHWHTFRHTTAMLIWNESHNLSEVQHVLGHSNPATSLVYLAESDRTKGLKSLDKALEGI